MDGAVLGVIVGCCRTLLVVRRIARSFCLFGKADQRFCEVTGGIGRQDHEGRLALLGPDLDLDASGIGDGQRDECKGQVEANRAHLRGAR